MAPTARAAYRGAGHRIVALPLPLLMVVVVVGGGGSGESFSRNPFPSSCTPGPTRAPRLRRSNLRWLHSYANAFSQ